MVPQFVVGIVPAAAAAPGAWVAAAEIGGVAAAAEIGGGGVAAVAAAASGGEFGAAETAVQPWVYA